MKLIKSRDYMYMFRQATEPDPSFWPGHDNWQGYFKHTRTWFNSYMHNNDQIGYYIYLTSKSFYV